MRGSSKATPPSSLGRSSPHPTCRVPLDPWWFPHLASHRRLRVRATVSMTPVNMRKGNQVFRNPAQLERDREGWRKEGKPKDHQRSSLRNNNLISPIVLTAPSRDRTHVINYSAPGCSHGNRSPCHPSPIPARVMAV